MNQFSSCIFATLSLEIIYFNQIEMLFRNFETLIKRDDILSQVTD